MPKDITQWPANKQYVACSRLPDIFRLKMQAVFRDQAAEACRRKLPVIVHSRGADRDMLALLKECFPRDQKIHMHCWSSSGEYLRELVTYFPNLRIGVAGHFTTSTSMTWVAHPMSMPDFQTTNEQLPYHLLNYVGLDRVGSFFSSIIIYWMRAFHRLGEEVVAVCGGKLFVRVRTQHFYRTCTTPNRSLLSKTRAMCEKTLCPDPRGNRRAVHGGLDDPRRHDVVRNAAAVCD